MSTPIENIAVTRNDGGAATLGDYTGRVRLVVNVASKCGLTPQYEGLERLYEEKRAAGLEVLAFPANNFKGQEPGIDAEIIDLRTIRPMDIPTVVESVKKTGRLVTVEEGFPQSSVGTEIATRVMQQAFDYLDAPILTIAGKDVPMPYAANLEKLALPNVAEVVEAVKAVTYTA